jgi:hypothetical protein
MERHQRIQLKTTSRSTNQPFKVSSFQTRGFGVQQKAASTPASKAELWENYQRSSQIVQQGAGGTRSAIQAKLSIGQPGDKYEQEADSVADRVMAMSEPAQVQREELGEEEEELQMKPLAGMISPLVQREELPEEEEELQMKPEDHLVQREELPEEEEELQMKSLDNSIQREELPEEEEEIQMKQAATSSTPAATTSLEDRLSSSKGGGSPLSDDVRSFMEPRFGADFSGVRVHTGSDAVQMNQDVSAQAFAHGQDVYFGAGKAPGKDALTAHELTHVVQQTGSVQLKCTECDDETSKIQRKAQITPQKIVGVNLERNLIQRDKIDHRPLTWDDFKQKPPASRFDAETASGISDPHLAEISPKTQTADYMNSACPGKANNKTFNVKIAVDPQTIEIKSFMDQDKSWKKAWTTDPKAMSTKCKADSRSGINECKKYFTDQAKEINTKCLDEQNLCQKDFDNTKNIASHGIAKNKGECQSVLFPDCVTEMKGQLEFDGAKIPSECDAKVIEKCIESSPDNRIKLLKHEQIHFDITEKKSKDIQSKIHEVASNFETNICLPFKELSDKEKKVIGAAAGAKALAAEVSAHKLAKTTPLNDDEKNSISQAASQKAITDVEVHEKEVLETVKKQAIENAKKELIKKLQDILRTEGNIMSRDQSTYDTETDHGVNKEPQKRWQDDTSQAIQNAEANISNK